MYTSIREFSYFRQVPAGGFMKVFTLKHTEEEGFRSVKEALIEILPVVKQWGGDAIEHSRVTGAFAKGTNVPGGADADLLISLAHDYNHAPVTIYKGLFEHLRKNGYPTVRAGHISIQAQIGNILIDLIPARKAGKRSEDHRVFNRKTGDWNVTNLNTHTQFVALSGRLSEIRLMKLWRNGKGLFLPSFLLELAVIEALKGQPPLSQTQELEKHSKIILSYLATDFVQASLVDPANPSNIVSEDLLKIERTLISNTAQKSLAGGWRSFVSSLSG